MKSEALTEHQMLSAYAIGQSPSASMGAVVILLIGGPLHGRSGLYEHSKWDSLQFPDALRKMTHLYEPMGHGRYVFAKSFQWDK